MVYKIFVKGNDIDNDTIKERIMISEFGSNSIHRS